MVHMCPCCLEFHSDSGGRGTQLGRGLACGARTQTPLLPSSLDCLLGPNCWTPCCCFSARCHTHQEQKQLLAYSTGQKRDGGRDRRRWVVSRMGVTKTNRTKNNHTESFYLLKCVRPRMDQPAFRETARYATVKCTGIKNINLKSSSSHLPVQPSTTTHTASSIGARAPTE